MKRLDPVRVPVLSVARVPVLEAKAGSTPRIRGGKWQRMRNAALLAGQAACAKCGRVHPSNQIDHVVPLEQGGSNDPANLQVLCVECHQAKTAAEAQARAGRNVVTGEM